MSLTTYKVKSPLMGRFYSAPFPGEKPYVEVGQQVNASDVSPRPETNPMERMGLGM